MTGLAWHSRLRGAVTVGLAFTDASSDFGDRARPAEAVRALVRSLSGAGQGQWMAQVHGARAVLVDGTERTVPEADALVTDREGVVLVTRVADCVPVLLADGDAAVVAAVHCGREGMRHGVLSAAVSAMREARATQIRAVVGPRICGRCYEVPEELRAEVAAVEPASHALTRWQTPGLDIGAGAAAQLTRLGCSVTDVERCTYEDPGLHSHRRDAGAAGRLAGLVWMALDGER